MTAVVPNSTLPRRRVEYIDGLRATAALAVLVHHAWAMVFPPEYHVRPHGALALTMPAKWGPYGVTVFIVLAGFSLTIGVARSDGLLLGGWWTFIKRRARRIIPPYWAAIALAALLSLAFIGHRTGTHWDLSVPLTWKGVLVDATLLQDVTYFDARNVAYTFWSIAVEWHIYFTFPVLLVIWRRDGYIAATVAGSAVGVIGNYAAHFSTQIETMHPDYYALFAIGMGACAIVQQRPRWADRTPWRLLTFAGLLVWTITGALHAPWYLAALLSPDLALGIATAALLVAVGTGTAPLASRVLQSIPLAATGEFSYSIYLVHAPLLAVVWTAVVAPLHLGQLAALGVMWVLAVPLSIAASYGFHRIAERPFMTKVATTRSIDQPVTAR